MRASIFSLVLVLGLTSFGMAQPELFHMREDGAPFFIYEISNLASDDLSKSRLVAEVRIPYDELQFLKLSDSLYQADAEITFIVLDKDGDQVEGKSFRRKISAKTFDQTNSNRLNYVLRVQMDLPPGKYTVLCEITDMDSRKTGKQKANIELRDFSSDHLSVSDLLIREQRELSANEARQISQHFPKIAKSGKPFLVVRFEIYNPQGAEHADLKYSLRNFRNREMDKGELSIPLQGFNTPISIPFSKDKLYVGNYLLKLEVKTDKEKLKLDRPFRTRSVTLPVAISNLDVAIDQLRYIADKKDIDRMRKAPDSLRRRYFEEYWKKNDPTPGTEANELMEEYYRRVAFSNANFTAFQEGWKTDMGMVFILFGPPNDIERQPYNVTSNPYGGREVYAYELWYYYDINKRFIFVDERGFGEFRLLNPNDIYINR